MNTGPAGRLLRFRKLDGRKPNGRVCRFTPTSPWAERQSIIGAGRTLVLKNGWGRLGDSLCATGAFVKSASLVYELMRMFDLVEDLSMNFANTELSLERSNWHGKVRNIFCPNQSHRGATRHYNQERPNSSLGYITPAAYAARVA